MASSWGIARTAVCLLNLMSQTSSALARMSLLSRYVFMQARCCLLNAPAPFGQSFFHCNNMVLQVMRFSDGSYLEDMDHWWLSGIYRRVVARVHGMPARFPLIPASKSGRCPGTKSDLVMQGCLPAVQACHPHLGLLGQDPPHILRVWRAPGSQVWQCPGVGTLLRAFICTTPCQAWLVRLTEPVAMWLGGLRLLIP